MSLIALYINYNNKEPLNMDNEIYNDKDSFLNEYVKKRLQTQEEEVNEYQGKKLVEKDGKLEIIKERPIADVYRVKTDDKNIYGLRKNNKVIYEENSKGNGLNYNVVNGLKLNNDPFDAGTDVAVGPDQITDVVPNYTYGVKRGKIAKELMKGRGSTDGTISLPDIKFLVANVLFKYFNSLKLVYLQ